MEPLFRLSGACRDDPAVSAWFDAGDPFAQLVDHGRRQRVDLVFLRDPEADQGAGSSDGP